MFNVESGVSVTLNGNVVNADTATTWSYTLETAAIEAFGEGAETLTAVATDAAGNTSTGTKAISVDTSSAVDLSIVVFDLVEGISSDHSGHTFTGASVAYEIYIRVPSTSALLSSDGTHADVNLVGEVWTTWKGAATLGSDDAIYVVGDGATVLGQNMNPVLNFRRLSETVLFSSVTGGGVYFSILGNMTRLYNGNVDFQRIWTDTATTTVVTQNISTKVGTAMPLNLLVSQGLALA